MDHEFKPGEIVERHCAEHDIAPEDMLIAVLEALGRYHLWGNAAFPELQPAPGSRQDVAAEIEAHLIHQAPARHRQRQLPASLLEAVTMCVEWNAELNDDSAWMTLDMADSDDRPERTAEYQVGTKLGELADAQDAAADALRECMNQLEAMKLQQQLAAEV